MVEQNHKLVDGFTSLGFIHTASRENVLSPSFVQDAVWVVQLVERLHLLITQWRRSCVQGQVRAFYFLFLCLVQQSENAGKGALKE